MAKKTSQDLAEDIAGIAEQIRDRAIAETRKDVADSLKEQYLGDKRVPRSTFSGSSPDDCIIETLKFMSDAQLKALHDRFSSEGVSEDFRAGLLFAIRLAGDPNYEL